MEFKTCFSSCAGALFFSVRKTHGNCIMDAEMECCPSCEAYTDSTGSACLCSPIHHRPSPPADVVVVEEDSDDEGPSASRPAETRRLNDLFNLSRGRVVVGQADTCTSGYEANLCWYFLEYWALPSTNDWILGNSCRQICGRYGTNKTNPDIILFR